MSWNTPDTSNIREILEHLGKLRETLRDKKAQEAARLERVLTFAQTQAGMHVGNVD